MPTFSVPCDAMHGGYGTGGTVTGVARVLRRELDGEGRRQVLAVHLTPEEEPPQGSRPREIHLWLAPTVPPEVLAAAVAARTGRP